MKLAERHRDWRWQIITELVSANKRLPMSFRKDKLMADAFGFWNAFQKCVNSSTPSIDTMKVEDAYPDISAAYSIFSSNNVERFFIEALVLSGESVTDIGVDSGYSPRVIRVYESLFFDVRDKLSHKLYVMGTLLGPVFGHGVSAGDYDHLWKAIGYFCGAETLRSLWKLGGMSEADSAAVSNILRSRLLSQAMAASFARRPNSYNANEIIENYIHHEQFTKETKEPDNTADNPDNYLARIKADVLTYMDLSLRPYTDVQPAVERCCMSGAESTVKEEDYDRPFKS